MAKTFFSKPALTVIQQISQLNTRGMLIDDITVAQKKLLELNYYRLEGYWLPLEIEHKDSQFILGSTFNLVLNWYNTDLSLKTILFEAISSIEVSFRTKWAYYMSTKYNPFSYLNPEYFEDRKNWLASIQQFSSDLFRSKETFIEHFIDSYKDFFPPEWAAVEVMSLGTLSHLYQYMNLEMPIDSSDIIPAKTAIANDYDLSIRELVSWMHSINVCRNLCAHQSRIVSSYLTIQPVAPKSTNPMNSLWYYQYKSKENITIQIPADKKLRTCTGVELLLNEKDSIGNLPTGLLIYLPNDAKIQNGISTSNLPDDTVLFLPIGSKIQVITDTIFKIPKGTIIDFPASYTVSFDSIESFCSKENNLWYNLILSICYLYEKIMDSKSIRYKIRDLLRSNIVYSHLLGFPVNWQSLSFWV